ncbi:MAG: RNA polymerase factor sigma-54 [Planctomycetota bacterium]
MVQAQVQKQILSPQMIQSMEILVLNAEQLEERLEQALEENVALELAEEGRQTEEAPPTADGALDGEGAPVQEADATGGEIDLLRDRYEHIAEFEAEEYYNAPGRFSSFHGEEDDKYEALQNTADRPKSLQEHLTEQVQLKSALNEHQRLICQEVIYSLDSRGYLLYPIEGIHEALSHPIPEPANGVDPLEIVSLTATLEEVREALRVIQSLDPAGVGASSLEDCLLLQLDRDPVDYPLEKHLIRHHLRDIAKNRLPQIAKASGASLEEIKDAVEIISSLNPLPGSAFAPEANRVVRPDVIIDEFEGEFRVRVENESLPRVRISPYYRQLLLQSRKDPEIRKYVKKKIENAEWLLNAIHQRKSTLQRVAEEVVAHQQEFFRKGERHLQPLKMQEIADRIGVNVSTVSRAIAGKYFQAPGCVRELKHLFTGGTVRDDGASESRGSVILRIKDLIAGEDRSKPLSDSKIVAQLAKSGIHISRRTVTKYREAEGIPSSRERRLF